MWRVTSRTAVKDLVRTPGSSSAPCRAASVLLGLRHTCVPALGPLLFLTESEKENWGVFFSLLGGGFEWDDDFSPDPFMAKTTSNLLSSKPSLQTSKYFSPPPPPRSTEQSWPHTPPYSRFSISPANIASFSLTHLTDSDMEQGGERRAVCPAGLGGRRPARPSPWDLHAC